MDLTVYPGLPFMLDEKDVGRSFRVAVGGNAYAVVQIKRLDDRRVLMHCPQLDRSYELRHYPEPFVGWLTGGDKVGNAQLTQV